ncbi:hypothetical protein [Lysobacter gummosus]|uniref:hypothetical protein n=1 Tax=Lysobacter gummosus TaxID=262324 RepID=UPI00362930B0
MRQRQIPLPSFFKGGNCNGKGKGSGARPDMRGSLERQWAYRREYARLPVSPHGHQVQ